MPTPRTLVYLGSSSDSEARIALRNMPHSPRTWLYIPEEHSQDWREVLSSLTPQSSSEGRSLFSIWSTSNFHCLEALEKACHERVCDHLFIYGLSKTDLSRTDATWRKFIEWSIKAPFDLHLFVFNESEEDATTLEESIFPRQLYDHSLRFWIPSQAQSLRYIQLSSRDFLAHSPKFLLNPDQTSQNTTLHLRKILR